MAVRNRTIIRQEVTYAAGDAAITDNLPVNPLSFVDIILRGITLTTITIPTVVNILATLSNIEVLFNGSAFISISPRDLYALQSAMGWVQNVPQPRDSIDATPYRLLLRVSFSRRPFWLNEGFPASRAGELQLRLTPAASYTNVETTSLTVETEEILDGAFENFLRYTTLARTPAATGEQDLDLPIGQRYAGILLFSTTVPTGTAITSDMIEVRLLMDNQEAFVPRTRWDSLHQNFMMAAGSHLWLMDHIHHENTASAYTANASTLAARIDAHALNLYGWIEFDPLRDGSYLLPTLGRSSVKLRINSNVATPLAQRVIPVELVAAGGQRAVAAAA